MRVTFTPSREHSKVESIAASGVENDILARYGGEVPDRVDKWLCNTQIVQSPAPRDRIRRIARLLRPPVLRLEQIEISAARGVERMLAGANQAAVFTSERKAAIAHRTKEHQVFFAPKRRPMIIFTIR
jgi:hypothetical protein